MKGQSVGNVGEVLLWPSAEVMQSLRSLVRSRSQLLYAEVAPADLLWPAELINNQARLRHSKNFALPLSIVSFIISAVLGFVIGPMQLVLLITTSYGYNWVTTIYYTSALKYVLLISSFVALLNIGLLVLAWRAQPHRTRMVATLSCASLCEIGLIWIFAAGRTLPPHHLALILLAGSISGLVIALLLHSQYTTATVNGLAIKIFLGILGAVSLVEAIGGITYFAKASARPDAALIQQITAEQNQVRAENVSMVLSNSIFTLCDGRYQVIYLTEDNNNSGIFECNNNGEVYSAMEIASQNPNTIDTAATYLGTTKNTDIALSFPAAHFLYRSIPDALSEDELVMMVQATTERDLVDNLVNPLLEFWQNHNAHNLYLNIFYTRDLDSITGTRDFILMAALDTMALVEKLPGGNTLKGYHEGEATNYLYVADTELRALQELGNKPELIAPDVLDALTFRKHLSLHLTANTAYDYDVMYQLLNKSFAGGAEG